MVEAARAFSRYLRIRRKIRTILENHLHISGDEMFVAAADIAKYVTKYKNI